MNAVVLIKNDHEVMKDHMERFKSAYDQDDAGTVESELRTLCELLVVHSVLEENYFYPAVQKKDDLMDIVQEGFEEHAVADQLVEEIQNLTSDDPELRAKGKVLVELVEHHMKEEEDELLPKAEKALDERTMEELGQKLQEVKEKAMANV